MRETYGMTLARLGEKYTNLVVLDADLSKSTNTAKFAKVYPERFFNMGIAEQDMMSTAAGLTAGGMITFASTFAMFGSGRAWEQIRNSICYPNLPVKIVVTHAGLSVGEDGPTHQACEDIAIMRALPNMKVIAPADSVETEKVIEFLMNYKASPVYVRLARMKTDVVFDESYKFTLGQARILKVGGDITIVSTGTMINQALAAAILLEKDGIKAEIIHMGTIKPLDEETLVSSARKTGAVMTIEEHSIIGGLGSAVCECLAENYPVRVRRMGVADTFAESGTPEALFEKYGLTEKHIYGIAKEFVKNKK